MIFFRIGIEVSRLSNSLNLLANTKRALSAQLDEAKSRADNEKRETTLLLGKFGNSEGSSRGFRA